MSHPIPLILAIALTAGSAAARAAADTSSWWTTPPKDRGGVVSPTTTEATPWRRWGGTWIRLEADGNLSCFSFNGKHCEWKNAIKNPYDHPQWEVQPLVCGVKHHLQWGVNGYNDDADYGYGTEHWCRSAYAEVYATWHDYSVLGFDMLLSETPAGDAMCLSANGRTCASTTEINAWPMQAQPLKPLVCGAHHRRMLGFTGYDQPEHWCRSPKITHRKKNVDIGREIYYLPVTDWLAEQEPAMIVRADLSDDLSMSLGATVRIQEPWLKGMGKEGQVGFGLGAKQAVIIEQYIFASPWKGKASTGLTTAALATTSAGRLCFFGSQTPMDPTGKSFFQVAPLRGNSSSVMAKAKQPDFKVVRSPYKLMPPQVAIKPSEENLRDLVVSDFLITLAREVPVEGDLTGKRERISYIKDCGNP
ncbi:hypothetical protein [Roseateles sp.]|uniref:hypothetical protein n=1 Tax=Roseateles sp. TaxID=1971397 RepID=UPI0031CF751A